MRESEGCERGSDVSGAPVPYVMSELCGARGSGGGAGAGFLSSVPERPGAPVPPVPPAPLALQRRMSGPGAL